MPGHRPLAHALGDQVVAQRLAVRRRRDPVEDRVGLRLLGGVVDLRVAGVARQAIRVQAVATDELRVHRRRDARRPAVVERRVVGMAERAGDVSRRMPRVDRLGVVDRARRVVGERVAVAHRRRPVDDPVQVGAGPAEQVRDQALGAAGRGDVVLQVLRDQLERRVGARERLRVTALLVVAPHPARHELRVVRDVAHVVAVGIDGVHAAGRAERRERARHLRCRAVAARGGLPRVRRGLQDLADRARRGRAIAQRGHVRVGDVDRVAGELALLTGRRVEERLLRRVHARALHQREDVVERRVVGGERRRATRGDVLVLRDRGDVGGGEGLPRAGRQDLQVAPAPVEMRLRDLRAVLLGVPPAHVRALGVDRAGARARALDEAGVGVRARERRVERDAAAGRAGGADRGDRPHFRVPGAEAVGRLVDRDPIADDEVRDARDLDHVSPAAAAADRIVLLRR